MIVTVTANPAVDKTLAISGFTVGATNRASVARVDVGGKGINVARTLALLGCDVVATGFLGRTDTYGVLPALAAQRIDADFVRVDGDVRVNLKILDDASGAETEINDSGRSVTAEAIQALSAKLRALLPRCSVMVFSGSLPPGTPDDVYAQWIELASRAGVRTVLDTAGPALRAGAAAGPDLIKPNRAEAEELLGMPLRADAELASGARRLLDRGPRHVVISLGPGGAISASAEGVWRARAPHVAAKNTVGAGDAMVAGLALGLSRALPLPEALRLAVALGTAAATSATPCAPPERAEALLPGILLDSWPLAGMPASQGPTG